MLEWVAVPFSRGPSRPRPSSIYYLSNVPKVFINIGSYSNPKLLLTGLVKGRNNNKTNKNPQQLESIITGPLPVETPCRGAGRVGSGVDGPLPRALCLSKRKVC